MNHIENIQHAGRTFSIDEGLYCEGQYTVSTIETDDQGEYIEPFDYSTPYLESARMFASWVAWQ